ncbi:MAG: quinone oxidoreductase [Devosia sp.]
MVLEDRDLGRPGAGQLLVRNKAIGINFVDVYERKGMYKVDLPFTPGNEGAGEVVAVGEGVTEFRPGDRVGYTGPSGAYAEERLLPAGKAVHLPDDIGFDVAAAVMLKGGTAHYLLFETWPLKAGESILVHAAAGGVGSLLVQWASAMGATVIATAGSEEKLAAARAHGAKFAFSYKDAAWPQQAREATGGRGVDVVYDGVGKVTFEPSLDTLRPRGLMVSYGNASGAVDIPNLGILAAKGSLYVTRPTTRHYHSTPEDLRRTMDAVFGAVRTGKIKPQINQRFGLADAPEAHRALEARNTTGATLLIP